MKDTTNSAWEDGWLVRARRVSSPNFGPRPLPCEPQLLVIHNISLPPGHYGGSCIEELFTNCLDWGAHPYFEEIRGMEVSSHFLIRREGELLQFVSCDDRAWHAGASCYQGRENCNDFSIGIELEGTDDEPYEDVQYDQLARLTAELARQYRGISTADIVGHSDIAPGRKTDPGPFFDWGRLHSNLAALDSA